jgi:hypothetical protein
MTTFAEIELREKLAQLEDLLRREQALNHPGPSPDWSLPIEKREVFKTLCADLAKFAQENNIDMAKTIATGNIALIKPEN